MAEHTVTSPPSSPGISPVKLSDCMEDLAKFTISTYLSEGAHGLGCNLQLPREFCYGLLQDDQPLSNINTLEDDSAGVPAYPLYKHLARAIDRSIKSGTFLRRRDSNISIPINESLGEKEKVWEQLIADKGLELSEMVKGVEFELHVQEPYFSQLGAGQKTVEGRCAVGNYNRIAPGSVLLFNKCLLLKVEHVMRYSSFSEMLLVETLSNVLPGVETIEEGVEIYRRFYTEEKEFSNGVLAISVSKPTSQLYICLANLLSGLGCDGVSALLGMVHTAGTVPDALPPPRSSLVLSSMKPLRPNVVS